MHKDNAFTRWLHKKGLDLVGFAVETRININTVFAWAYHRFKPSKANITLAQIKYPDFPKGEK